MPVTAKKPGTNQKAKGETKKQPADRRGTRKARRSMRGSDDGRRSLRRPSPDPLGQPPTGEPSLQRSLGHVQAAKG